MFRVERVLGAWLSPDTRLLGVEPVPDVVGAATPWFFVLMVLELACSLLLKRKVYNLRQSINNLSAGVLTVLLGLFFKFLHVYPYQALHSRWALLPAPASPAACWATHAACFLLCDLGFYLFHRTCHASNLGWSAHVVHHSSPDFNLSTALRQGAGESVISWAFYLPLALFCPLHIYALHRGINTVYQFFTHTELIGKLWWPLELVLNTPSHHRVHHARNYGRRNFAGVLIIWDRAFGTFEEEDAQGRPCIYGLDARVRPLGTYNPLWHQLQHLACTLHLALTQGPLLEALLTRQYGAGMVMPSVTDAEPPRREEAAAAGATNGKKKVGKGSKAAKSEQRGGAKKCSSSAFPWDPRPLGPLDYYVAAQFFGAGIPAALCVLAGPRMLSPLGVAAGAAWVALTITTLGQLLDGTVSAVRWELLRLGVQVAALKAMAWWGLLPAGQAWVAGWWVVGALTSSSIALLAGQLAFMAPPPGGRKAAAKKKAA